MTIQVVCPICGVPYYDEDSMGCFQKPNLEGHRLAGWCADARLNWHQ